MTNYQITETFPTPILQDFNRFLDFFGHQPHPLTGQRSFLRRKDLYELNRQLIRPSIDVTARNDQPAYPQIHLFYYLCRNSRLFTLELKSDSRQFIWQPNPERIETYLSLNPVEQYFFLFKTLWVYSDWEEIQPAEQEGRVFPALVDEFFIELAKPEHEAGKWISLGGKKWSHGVFTTTGIIHYLEYFGFWECVEASGDEVYRTRTFRPVSRLKMTPFGKSMVCRIAEAALPSQWNYFMAMEEDEEDSLNGFSTNGLHDPDELVGDEFTGGHETDSDELHSLLRELLEAHGDGQLSGGGYLEREEEEEDEEEGERSPLEAYFRDLFPLGELGKVEVFEAIEFRPGRYLFRVYLKFDPDVWRLIELDANHTLSDLHEIIQNAYGFDDDHLYAFYLNDKPFSKIAVFDHRGEQPPFASEVRIGDMGLSERIQFLYLFDFGDQWEFEVLLLRIDPTASTLRNPVIRQSHGDSPPQYGEGEEDEEEEDEDEYW